MKVELTDNIDALRPNNNNCVLVVWEKGDRNFKIKGGLADWTPKHNEILEILKHLFVYENERYPKIRGFKGSRMLLDEIIRIEKEVSENGKNEHTKQL